MKKIIIFDIDGTLADLTHRVHLVRTKPHNWPAFFAGVGDDDVIVELAFLADLLHKDGHKIILCSGRGKDIEKNTVDWLNKHKIKFDDIYMRAEKDYRDDTIVKSELADLIEKDHGPIFMVFDDRQKVVDMWRARGIKTLQCAKGDF